jgi:hypothetical protein
MADLWLVATDPGAAALVPTTDYVSFLRFAALVANSLLIARLDCRMRSAMMLESNEV